MIENRQILIQISWKLSAKNIKKKKGKKYEYSISEHACQRRKGGGEEEGWKHLEGEVEQSFRAHGRLVCRGWTF